MEQFFIVLRQIAIFLILIIFGVLAVRTKILDRSGLNTLSRVIMRMALPAYIFINTAEGATRAGLISSLWVIPITAGLYGALFLLSLLIQRLFHLTGNRSHIFRAVLMFGNVGFMGIPLVVALYPDTALLYISLFTILDQALFWTYGVSLTKPVTGEKRPFSTASLKNLLSPALIAIVLATLLVVLGVRLPTVLSLALTHLGSASFPLSLLYIGGMLSLTDVRKVLRCGELYAEILLKMLALPIAFYALLRLLPIPADMAGTMAFVAGLPSINLVPMQANANGSDGEYAVCAVMLTTLACLVTLPLVSLGVALIP
ncbi:MAG: AEC family transporter [Oscillospiraceae bacterium]|nr:AEC family transporter [Oscillospiraceae bacterium]